MLTICILATGFFVNIIFKNTLQASLEEYADKTLLGQALWRLVPVAAVIIIFHGIASLPRELGLNQLFTKAELLGILFTLPVLAGAIIFGNLNTGQPVSYLLAKCFKEGFTEEVFFRAFLFGQLFRHCKWPFIPAVLLPAAIFGIGHLYQGDSFGASMAAFGVTFLGAVWFSWLYAEWNFNIWVTVAMHFLMNFYWALFTIGNGATGNVISNICRGITIFVSIYVTIKMAKRRGYFAVNKNNLLRAM
jgi:membrane protease YdiL (CAAX protease family)